MTIHCIDKRTGRGQIRSVTTKTTQLQIRVSLAEKAALRGRADEAGLDLSSYVLARVLPRPAREFAEIVSTLGRGDEQRKYILAALEDLLMPLSAAAFVDAVRAAPGLNSASAVSQNLVAAMVELAAAWRDLSPPAWTLEVPSLDVPWFATELRSLRAYLLASSPVPFRRRNLFVEFGLGGRV